MLCISYQLHVYVHVYTVPESSQMKNCYLHVHEDFLVTCIGFPVSAGVAVLYVAYYCCSCSVYTHCMTQIPFEHVTLKIPINFIKKKIKIHAKHPRKLCLSTHVV